MNEQSKGLQRIKNIKRVHCPTNKSRKLQIRTSVSPVFAESMSSKSELEDVVESVESPQSKFDLDEDDEQTPYPSTPSRRPNVDYFRKFLKFSNVPEIPLPSVFHSMFTYLLTY